MIIVFIVLPVERLGTYSIAELKATFVLYNLLFVVAVLELIWVYVNDE